MMYLYLEDESELTMIQMILSEFWTGKELLSTEAYKWKWLDNKLFVYIHCTHSMSSTVCLRDLHSELQFLGYFVAIQA